MSFAFAEIKLTNLEKNVANIRKEIGNGVRILAVVKANAYGHGSVEISKKLTSLNVNDLAVATYEEAIEIQSAGIKANILILGSITSDNIFSDIFISALPSTPWTTILLSSLECSTLAFP